MDCFAALGLSPSASVEEVQHAYRQQSQRLHPDHRPGDEQAAAQFRALHAAYEEALASARRREVGDPPRPKSQNFDIAGRTYARQPDGLIAWRNDATGEWTPVANGPLPLAGHFVGRGAGRIARWWRS